MPVPSAQVAEKVLTVVEIDGEVNISDMGAKHLDGTSGLVAGTHGLTSYESFLANKIWLRGRNIRGHRILHGSAQITKRKQNPTKLDVLAEHLFTGESKADTL